MPPVVPNEPALGRDRIGPYRLIRPISVGGMAKVYEGRFDSLAGVSTRVAIKVIHPDFANEGGFQDLFIQEARISARLEHLNVVRVQQFNREGDLYYLVMEYIDGVTFRKIVTACKKHGLRLSPALLAELGRQACEGLHYAHVLTDDHGQPLRLVHRDMKPSNLMLNVQGVAKVLDFGISYATGQQESRGSVKGTWGYMAPEQAEGEAVGPAADLFGLASVLYEVITLEPLFAETDNAAIRRALASDEAARRAAAIGGPNAELAGTLVRALQRDPAARYPSGGAMARALGALVPDPMGARDELVRFVTELRRLDQGGASPGADRMGSAASVSTLQGSGLPVVTGSLHAPARQKNKPAVVKRPGLWAATFSIVFALFSVTVLAFTAWRIVRRPEPVPVSVEPASPIVAPVPEAAPAAIPAALELVSVATPIPAEGAQPLGQAEAEAPATPAATSVPSRPSTAPAKPSRETPRAADLVAGLGAEPSSASTAGSASTAAGSASAARADGILSVSATPRAQVMVDGAYVRFTPLFQYAVSAGPHSVLLVTADGRRKSFRVDVAEGVETRRIWLFDEERWADAAAPKP